MKANCVIAISFFFSQFLALFGIPFRMSPKFTRTTCEAANLELYEDQTLTELPATDRLLSANSFLAISGDFRASFPTGLRPLVVVRLHNLIRCNFLVAGYFFTSQKSIVWITGKSFGRKASLMSCHGNAIPS